MQQKIAILIMIYSLMMTFNNASEASISKENGIRNEVETVHYAVSVPVTNVWRMPNNTRNLDAISIAPNPDMAKWTDSFDG